MAPPQIADSYLKNAFVFLLSSLGFIFVSTENVAGKRFLVDFISVKHLKDTHLGSL